MDIDHTIEEEKFVEAFPLRLTGVMPNRPISGNVTLEARPMVGIDPFRPWYRPWRLLDTKRITIQPPRELPVTAQVEERVEQVVPELPQWAGILRQILLPPEEEPPPARLVHPPAHPVHHPVHPAVAEPAVIEAVRPPEVPRAWIIVGLVVVVVAVVALLVWRK